MSSSNNSYRYGEALSTPSQQKPPTKKKQNESPSSTLTLCRRIQFWIPTEALPMLSEQAVDPNFFKASHLVQELSCSSKNNTSSIRN